MKEDEIDDDDFDDDEDDFDDDDDDFDDDDENDDEVEEIIESGEAVFTLDWDGGGEYGGGSDGVYRWKKKFAISSMDTGNDGPYASLDEALEAGGFLEVNEAISAIHCTMLTDEELAARLTCDEDRVRIRINGRVWVYDAKSGKFQRYRRGKG